ncbi:MAG: hypothetical protein PWP28_317 [Oceanotoga sp.]|jgi:ABC-type sugar transport system permease subunit|uniref:Carbohydrate ABC transporter membrane protein 1 (CUT1 family) n=1 Tax=Oceanotoga teriensis TaxID=515440 RepID=A0AA45C702_9BACT|nr:MULTISPECIES: sugar ABC transporter permease [Oceanotoga]MDN5341442.1 hypothetical protein [Oceanotoga sp.]PWJ95104.1 carbohydrate ABC transporter membrane protein 1 (CUT1 family) [Oceanotoga teriensis]
MTKKSKKKIVKTAILFIMPVIIYNIIFKIIPIFYSLILSFTNYDGFSSPIFIGIKNYLELLKSQEFGNSILRTGIFALEVLPLNMLISLILAIMINNKIKGISFFRGIYYLPVITPMVAVSIIWVWLYDPEYGIINFLLSLFNIPPVYFLADSSTALSSISVMRIWRGVGWNMIIYLAGLQNISKNVYEAAKLDGATEIQSFWKITLPLLRPVHIYVLIVGIISTFQSFTEMYVMTGGGPLESTTTVGLLIYREAFEYMNMGMASSMSFILGIIILILSFMSFKLNSKNNEGV